MLRDVDCHIPSLCKVIRNHTYQQVTWRSASFSTQQSGEEPKFQQNKDSDDIASKLTQEEIKAIYSLKNIEDFKTIIPKFNALEPKIENTGKEFSKEIIANIFPQLLKIIDKYEPLISAYLLIPKMNLTNG